MWNTDYGDSTCRRTVPDAGYLYKAWSIEDE
jgi:hypothetical protein